MDGFLSWFNQLQWEKVIVMAISIISCLICIVFHEVCHGLAAFLMGDNTAKRYGRLSLNPIRHIDIVGLIMLLTVHFGWAKPVPVDMRRFKKPKLGMAVTALAGPVGNFVLAFVFSAVYGGFLAWYQYNDSAAAYYLILFLVTVISLNIGLGIFNLFPIPPLDGSKILFSFLPPACYLKLMQYERFGTILLVALLFLGVLDGPLHFLREGALNFMMNAVAMPMFQLVFGLIQ